MRQASTLYRLLGDEARLRLLRVLSRERLNVTELTGILGLAQSGVSRHLGLLKDAGFVVEEKDAGYTYYTLAPTLKEDGRRSLWAALDEQFAAAASEPSVRADDARLQEVLRLRKENFETHGAVEDQHSRGEETFQTTKHGTICRHRSPDLRSLSGRCGSRRPRLGS
jgi:ArsR family transcriptional regulator